MLPKVEKLCIHIYVIYIIYHLYNYICYLFINKYIIVFLFIIYNIKYNLYVLDMYNICITII